MSQFDIAGALPIAAEPKPVAPPPRTGLDIIKHRDILGFVLNDLGLVGKMAEVGACRGAYAKTVLSQWKGTDYYMVDPWKTQDPEVYRERQSSQEEYDQFYEEAKRVAAHDKRVVLMRQLSEVAAPLFPDLSLDCVYLDGNHSYRAVLEDMSAWWTKIRIGGIMGGHDFQTKTDEGWFCEVDKAVLRWACERGFVVYVCPCSSWWIHKSRE